jgi:hypothetical protein
VLEKEQGSDFIVLWGNCRSIAGKIYFEKFALHAG